jgi:hypothetical protein
MAACHCVSSLSGLQGTLRSPGAGQGPGAADASAAWQQWRRCGQGQGRSAQHLDPQPAMRAGAQGPQAQPLQTTCDRCPPSCCHTSASQPGQGDPRYPAPCVHQFHAAAQRGAHAAGGVVPGFGTLAAASPRCCLRQLGAPERPCSPHRGFLQLPHTVGRGRPGDDLAVAYAEGTRKGGWDASGEPRAAVRAC